MEDDRSVYDSSAGTPTTESSTPEGIGVGSQSKAGGNKLDPVSASPTVGKTIAGRTVEKDVLGVADAPAQGENSGASRQSGNR